MGFCVDLGSRNFCVGNPTASLQGGDLSTVQGALIFLGILVIGVAFFISRDPS